LLLVLALRSLVSVWVLRTNVWARTRGHKFGLNFIWRPRFWPRSVSMPKFWYSVSEAPSRLKPLSLTRSLSGHSHHRIPVHVGSVRDLRVRSPGLQVLHSQLHARSRLLAALAQLNHQSDAVSVPPAGADHSDSQHMDG